MEREKLGCKMEREKLGCNKEEERGQCSRISINGKDDDENAEAEAEECLGDNNNDDDLMMKKEISCHSLYGVLVKSHLDCLKMCVGEMEKIEFGEVIVDVELMSGVDDDGSELDEFMEAYCKTLKKVKEAIQEPQEESLQFINLMYSQLHHLIRDPPPPPP